MLAGAGRRVHLSTPGRHLGRPHRRAHRARAAAPDRCADLSREDTKRGRPRHVQRDLRIRRRAGRGRSRTPGGPDRQPSRGAGGGIRLRRGAGVTDQAGRTTRVRSFDRSPDRRGDEPRHPVDPAERGVAGPARTGEVPEADPRDDDLDDGVAGGRHRGRQEAHDVVARRGRAARPESGDGPHGGRCGAPLPAGSATRS